MPDTDKLNRCYNLRRRLKKRPRDLTLQKISADTGLTWEWLKRFHAGTYANPNTRLLDILEPYLDSLKADA